MPGYVNRREFVKTAGKASAAVSGLTFQNCSTETEQSTPATEPVQSYSASVSKETPNILWIVMDTARQDRFSCYGYPRETTPNIDALARESTLFERVISTSPWTVPTHASMFTGVYPSMHSVIGYTPIIDNAYPLIAELLRESGYQTAAFSNNPFISNEFGFIRGFETFQEPRTMLQQNNITSGDKGALLTNNLIREWLGDRRKDAPFFMFVNYLEPHQPYYELQEGYLSAFTDTGDLSGIIERLKSENTFDYAHVNGGHVDLTNRDVALLNAFYDANIRYLDMRIGELVSLLRDQGILDHTLLIVTADHGENLFDHGMVDHMFCVYNTLINVPLIIRLPGSFDAGSRERHRLVQDVDIIPTIMDITGLTWDGSDGMQGESLLKPSTRQFAISEYCPFLLNTINVFMNSPKREFELHRLASLQKAVVTDDYKFIWRSFGNNELYAVQDDPDEETNLATEYPEKVTELYDMLHDWLDTLPDRPTRPTSSQQGPGIQLTPERERQLRDLGYI